MKRGSASLEISIPLRPLRSFSSDAWLPIIGSSDVSEVLYLRCSIACAGDRV
jgi:hypothetical protein